MYHIATHFCTCHDSKAVVPCAKFHSDHFITTGMRTEENLNYGGKLVRKMGPMVNIVICTGPWQLLTSHPSSDFPCSFDNPCRWQLITDPTSRPPADTGSGNVMNDIVWCGDYMRLLHVTFPLSGDAMSQTVLANQQPVVPFTRMVKRRLGNGLSNHTQYLDWIWSLIHTTNSTAV